MGEQSREDLQKYFTHAPIEGRKLPEIQNEPSQVIDLNQRRESTQRIEQPVAEENLEQTIPLETVSTDVDYILSQDLPASDKIDAVNEHIAKNAALLTEKDFEKLYDMVQRGGGNNEQARGEALNALEPFKKQIEQKQKQHQAEVQAAEDEVARQALIGIAQEMSRMHRKLQTEGTNVDEAAQMAEQCDAYLQQLEGSTDPEVQQWDTFIRQMRDHLIQKTTRRAA